MKMKSILTLLLALVMVFTLFACSNAPDADKEDKDDSKETTAPKDDAEETTKPTENEPEDNNVTYTVKVVDENNNPIAGAMVQLCLDACIPGLTDASGVATFSQPAADYKVSFVQVPEGYTCDAEAFFFDGDSTEMTITVKSPAAQIKVYSAKFVDESGNAVPLVRVQFAKENGTYSSNVNTNEEGIAELNTFDVCTGVKIDSLPEGYTADATDYTFAEGASEVTITLKAA